MMSRETAISQAIAAAGGQIALQVALIRAGHKITQQAISLWKVQRHAPRDRHDAIAQAMSDDPDIQQQWLDALQIDVELAARSR